MQSANAISPKDIIDIAIRRRWLILTPLFLTLIFGIYYAFTAPKVYEATTLVMVEPQQIPENFRPVGRNGGRRVDARYDKPTDHKSHKPRANNQ
jgi:uncharacterized protein involved in exopolysaccharide biosynthesis